MDANIVVGTSAIAGLVLPLVAGFIKKKLAGGR